MPATSSLAPGELIQDRFQIVGPYPAFGVRAFEAEDRVTHEPAVLRWVASAPRDDGKTVARVTDDLRTLSSLQHPNLVHTQLILVHRGETYAVTARLAGRSFSDSVAGGRLSVADALRIVVPVAEALRAAHDAGMLHQRLVPESIFLEDAPGQARPTPRLLDLGLARLKSSAETRTESIHTGQLGAYSFLAPEQLSGQHEPSASIDVYGIAAVLYRALTGHAPVEAQKPVDLPLRAMHTGAIPLREHLPDAPAELAETIDAALALAPAQRPSMPSLLDRLRALASEQRSRPRIHRVAELMQAAAQQREAHAREPSSRSVVAPSGCKERVAEAARVKRRTLIVALLALGACVAFTVWAIKRTDVAPAQPPAVAPAPEQPRQPAPEASDWE